MNYTRRVAMNKSTYFRKIAAGLVLGALLAGKAFASEEDLRIVREGLLGAGVGATSSYASGGKGGQGALIGAGTQVIGNALIGILTESPNSRNSQPVYYQQPATSNYQQPRRHHHSWNPQPQPQPAQMQTQTVYVYRTEPVYIQQPQPQPVYYNYGYKPQEDYNRKIIKQGLMGATVGAISSYASGGKGGRGALIGAGTNVIGGSLLELLLSSR